MITLSDFILKLSRYAAEAPGNGEAEVMVQFDGDIAFAFSHAETHQAMGAATGIEQFLVLVPDCRGKRLKMKPSLKM